MPQGPDRGGRCCRGGRRQPRYLCNGTPRRSKLRVHELRRADEGDRRHGRRVHRHATRRRSLRGRHPRLWSLARRFEGFFRESVQINAYAAEGDTVGFAPDWDDHDVFVYQIDGSKHWEVYGPGREAPLFKDFHDHDRPAEPVWSGQLQAGDLLYLPRGWWHAARGTGDRTLHLSVGLEQRTGIDLVSWLVDTARSDVEWRRDLPRFSGQVERAAFLDRLRADLMVRLSDDVLDRYFAHLDAMARPRRRVTGLTRPDPECCDVEVVTTRWHDEITDTGYILRARCQPTTGWLGDSRDLALGLAAAETGGPVFGAPPRSETRGHC